MNIKTLVVLFAVIACAYASEYSRLPQAICREPLVTGPCRAIERKYGYDDEQKKCVEFIYGGCEGNDNNFSTLEACEMACENTRAA